jgi:formyltetrahydrofolate deformylase
MLVSCPDRPGIVAAISQFLFSHGANIVRSDQYSSDPSGGQFFMRVEFDLPGISGRLEAISHAFAPIGDAFDMRWRVSLPQPPKRVAIFASHEGHCLLELLWRWQAGELDADVRMVISNHRSLQAAVKPFGIPFHHIPVEVQRRAQAEDTQMQLLDQQQIELVVLARYMQILSADMTARYSGRMINIHHSFLPAFAGPRPYEQAYARGVKIIGATAHYVTEELDGGPIIEQDVQRVSHRDGVADLRRIGRQIERTVLARAVAWHLEDRILLQNNTTVVFH